mmetsp:Transcript_983/g.3139  ORF Transcript_983/g.3139 Transcript_983/m.3139 type:complete len:225 (+) Transcript_983:156-830(+)
MATRSFATDVIDAYLNGRMRYTPLFAQWPTGWPEYLAAEYGDDRAAWPYDPATHACCIDGNIPGSLDAGAIWRESIHPLILGLGFEVTPMSEAFYVRQEPGGSTSAFLKWTDDLLFRPPLNARRPSSRRLTPSFPPKAHASSAQGWRATRTCWPWTLRATRRAMFRSAWRRSNGALSIGWGTVVPRRQRRRSRPSGMPTLRTTRGRRTVRGRESGTIRARSSAF